MNDGELVCSKNFTHDYFGGDAKSHLIADAQAMCSEAAAQSGFDAIQANLELQKLGPRLNDDMTSISFGG